MISEHRPYIAREGWVFILFALVCAWVVHMSAGRFYAIPVWLLAVLLIYMFRDPNRVIPPIPLAVVSPVDGRIKSIDNIADPYLDRTATAISMRMNLSGPFVIRSPMEGKVMNQWLGAEISREQAHNLDGGTNPAGYGSNTKTRHYYAIWIQSDEGDDVVLILKRSMIGFRPRFYVHAGERVGQGQRCGFVTFGCKVLVFVPENSRKEIMPDNPVSAGSGVIATLIHK